MPVIESGLILILLYLITTRTLHFQNVTIRLKDNIVISTGKIRIAVNIIYTNTCKPGTLDHFCTPVPGRNIIRCF